jgi:hypothetical protein
VRLSAALAARLGVPLPKAPRRKREDLGDLMDFYLRAQWEQWETRVIGPPLWEREYMAVPGRKLRVDLAFVPQRLAIECQGGIWSKAPGAAHGAPLQILRNMEKQNLLTLAGWRLLQFDRKMIVNGTAVRQTLEALQWKP